MEWMESGGVGRRGARPAGGSATLPYPLTDTWLTAPTCFPHPGDGRLRLSQAAAGREVTCGLGWPARSQGLSEADGPRRIRPSLPVMAMMWKPEPRVMRTGSPPTAITARTSARGT